MAVPNWLPLAAVLVLSACERQQNGSTIRADVAKVTRGPIEITFNEAATIAALRETTVKSEVEGQATLIHLVPEGTIVKQGEKLAELDASSLRQRLATQEIAKARADAALVQAEKEHEILLKQNAADLLAAENEREFARMDLKKFLGREQPSLAAEAAAAPPAGDDLPPAPAPANGHTTDMGEREQELVAADTDIKLAEAELKVAADRLEWSRRLHEKGYITKNELERDELDHERRKSALVLARNKKDLLVRFTHKKTEMELVQKVGFANLEYERVEARNDAKLAQSHASVQSAKSQARLETEQLENLQKQIQNAVILAPTPGLVVYATQGGGGGGGMRDTPIEEGATVRERQAIIILPDTTQMRADLKVHESFIDKVRVGQRALVRVEALPHLTFTGTVRRISPLPDSGSRWSNPDLKVYKTEVVIDGENTLLRPGMSASVTVLIGEVRDALKIPITAIQRKGDIQYVWVETAAGPVAKPIQIGETNQHEGEVRSGLSEGEVVLLAPPPAPGEPFEDETEANGNSIAASLPEAPPAGAPEPAVRDAAPANGDRTRRQPSPEMTAFLELLRQKRPDLAPKLESGGMALFRDEEVRAAVEADPELAAKQAELMQGMRRMGNRGERRPGTGEPRGGEQRGTERGR